MSTEQHIWNNWLEIPVSDFNRAKKFYSTIFNIEIQTSDFGSFKMGVFPHKDSGCAICEGKDYHPGPYGPIPYMVAEPDLSEILNRIENAGGKILQSKKQISPELGYMALFNDTEGNKLALWSSK